MGFCMKIFSLFFIWAFVSAQGAQLATSIGCKPLSLEYQAISTNRAMVGEVGFDESIFPRTRWLNKRVNNSSGKYIDGPYEGEYRDQAIEVWDKDHATPISSTCSAGAHRMEYGVMVCEDESTTSCVLSCDPENSSSTIRSLFYTYWNDY